MKTNWKLILYSLLQYTVAYLNNGINWYMIDKIGLFQMVEEYDLEVQSANGRIPRILNVRVV